MDKRTFLKGLAVLAASASMPADVLRPRQPSGGQRGDWALNVDVLESCSCPVFCQCFFTGRPPATGMSHGHHMAAQHVCRFVQAYRVNQGHCGNLDLQGARFWFAGDAGDNFAKPKLEWAVLTFDSAMSKQQRDALLGILRHLRWYRPERWNSYTIGSPAPIHWAVDRRGGHATLGGTLAEVKLSTMTGLHDQPVMMMNMDYFGYPRNRGFVLMPSDLLAYRQAPHAFEYRGKGTNGLHTTLEIGAADFAQ